MSLEEYKEKRNFKMTSEPAGEVRNEGGNTYVVQKHQATHLHYDLRLERDGVLKSWAVPKEPPIYKGTKRLAIQVEDHPTEYADFDGTIPEGEYGAGTVEIWDRGTYETEKWKEDEIIIHIDGGKLYGRYCLVRYGRVENGWLFFKCQR